MIKYPTFVVLLFCYVLANAQTEELATKAVSVSYFGETLTHPGLALGVEHYPLQSPKHQLVWSVSVGGYLHPRNNTSFFARLQVGQRLLLGGKFMLENFVGIGYLRQRPQGGAVYRVLPNGAVVENKRSGSGKIMPSVALGIGYNGIKIHGKSIKVFARPEIFWKAPFNGYYLTHFAMNTGFIVPL